MFGLDNFASNILLWGAVSKSPVRGIFKCLGKGMFGLVRNSMQTGRIGCLVGWISWTVSIDRQKWKAAANRISMITKGLKVASKAIKHPDLFKSMNGFDALADGSKRFSTKRNGKFC